MSSKKLHPRGKPAWLKKKLPRGGDYQRVTQLLSSAELHTVCQEANCPNMFECFSKNTATFMILGSQCTRHCRFCNITAKPVEKVDPNEPKRVARTAAKLKLKYVVVTSVTRDDLEDGGAAHFAAVIRELKSADGPAKVEVLIPDFQGNKDALKTVLDAEPNVLNHNIETVPRLYSKARPEANYEQSLELIQRAKAFAPHIPTKSGLMVGLGETMEELIATMEDLHAHGCDILTIGQYLQPTQAHLSVEKFYTPEEFDTLEERARQIGFTQVAAGPFVRSSYNAEELYSS